MLPETSVDVPAFVADLEKRLAADEEAYSCCVCYEPFANVPLECCHTLCPTCFDKLETCPQCRVPFKIDGLVFHNFDASIVRLATNPRSYDIYLYSHMGRDPIGLLIDLLDIHTKSGVNFSHIDTCNRGDHYIFKWADARVAVEAIRKHSSNLNRTTTDDVRRIMFECGLLDRREICIFKR